MYRRLKYEFFQTMTYYIPFCSIFKGNQYFLKNHILKKKWEKDIAKKLTKHDLSNEVLFCSNASFESLVCRIVTRYVEQMTFLVFIIFRKYI